VGQNFQQIVQNNLRFEIEYYIYIFCLLISIVWFKESVFFQLHCVGVNEFSTLENTHGKDERLHIKQKIYLF